MNVNKTKDQKMWDGYQKIKEVFSNPHMLQSTHYLEMWLDDKEYGKSAKETIEKTLRKLNSIGMTEKEFNEIIEYTSENEFQRLDYE